MRIRYPSKLVKVLGILLFFFLFLLANKTQMNEIAITTTSDFINLPRKSPPASKFSCKLGKQMKESLDQNFDRNRVIVEFDKRYSHLNLTFDEKIICDRLVHHQQSSSRRTDIKSKEELIQRAKSNHVRNSIFSKISFIGNYTFSLKFLSILLLLGAHPRWRVLAAAVWHQSWGLHVPFLPVPAPGIEQRFFATRCRATSLLLSSWHDRSLQRSL